MPVGTKTHARTNDWQDAAAACRYSVSVAESARQTPGAYQLQGEKCIFQLCRFVVRHILLR